MAKKSTNNIVKAIPNSESGSRTTCKTHSGEEFIISYNPIKDKFTLWKPVECGFEKIDTGNSPLDFNKLLGYKDMIR